MRSQAIWRLGSALALGAPLALGSPLALFLVLDTAVPDHRPGSRPDPAVPGAAAARGVDTRLVVRVVAHDAKAIGSNVGGARVTVRDVATGDVLAEGIQEGTTGSTEQIMLRPRVRGEPVYDTEGTAAFVARLALDRPTRVEVIGEGPLGTPHAVQTASRTLVLVPGEHVEGEGLILELNGLTVRIDSVAPADGGGGVRVRAHVEMLCGCPIEPGGMWDADRTSVVARLLADGRPVAETPLAFAGVTSAFAGELPVGEPGSYELEVVASDAERANFGVARGELTVGG